MSITKNRFTPSRPLPLSANGRSTNSIQSAPSRAASDAIPFLVALVATCDRPHLLAGRALPSIAAQTRWPDAVIVVDDSASDHWSANRASVASFQYVTEIGTEYLRNSREAGASGAWNEGALAAARIRPPESVHLAILDDDDQWHPNHLCEVDRAVRATGADLIATTHAVVKDGRICAPVHPPTQLDQHAFLSRNPGITGSFLVVRLATFMRAGMFDESLLTCTDRDLCIRLAQLPRLRYHAIRTNTAIHYIDAERSQLSSRRSEVRRAGLARFLAKHGPRMTADETRAFLTSAKDRFGFSHAELMEELRHLPARPERISNLGQEVGK